MPPKKLTGDAGSVQALIAWLEERGDRVSSVTVGACRVDLLPAQPVAPAERAPAGPDRPGIYNKFGGDVFKDVVSELGPLVPALGVG